VSFTSLAFLFFFTIVFSLHWLAQEKRVQNLILVLASYIFYAWLTPWYAILLAISSLGDFYLAHGMQRERSKSNHYLGLSLALNLGILGLFKYYNFFNTQIAETLTNSGLGVDWLFIKIALPVGLSFYTLKKLAYILDVSRGRLEPSHDLAGFLLFVSFFPQIAAGPIDRFQQLMPQIEQRRAWKSTHLYSAWPLLVTGFFKKIVVANTMQAVVDRVFGLDEPSKIIVLAGAAAFTLQILADFSAYTDLSRGFARLLGFDTPENFNAPYLALTPTDFWNRWHITLSTWLRDYIFFPIRRLLLRSGKPLPNWLLQAIPPFATMCISGIWHGAQSTFLVWGAYYGLLIAGYQIAGIQAHQFQAGRPGRFLAWAIMFPLVVFGWLIFRAPSMGWLGGILFNAPWAHGQGDWAASLIILSMTIFYSLPLTIKLLLDRHIPPRSFVHPFYHALLTAGIVIFLGSATTDFIYFQF